MRSSTERRLMDDGYHFSGVYVRTYETEKLNERKTELKAEGYLVRQVKSDGGFSLLIKDTPKTLAAKEEKRKQDEVKRQVTAKEVAQFLRDVAKQIEEMPAERMPATTLTSLRYDVQNIMERGW